MFLVTREAQWQQVRWNEWNAWQARWRKGKDAYTHADAQGESLQVEIGGKDCLLM